MHVMTRHASDRQNRIDPKPNAPVLSGRHDATGCPTAAANNRVTPVPGRWNPQSAAPAPPICPAFPQADDGRLSEAPRSPESQSEPPSVRDSRWLQMLDSLTARYRRRSDQSGLTAAFEAVRLERRTARGRVR